MTNHTKGYRRDNAIIKQLEEWQVLDTDQIQHLYFPSLRMAQKRLQRLVELKKLHRARDYSGQAYYYYLEAKPGQACHRVGLNWVRLWLERELKSWEQLSTWQYEPNHKTVRPDGFMAVKNTVTGKLRFAFIERECDTNPFKKVKLYNDLYASEGYAGAWWADKADRFPPVIVVVESETRLAKVRGLIEKDNKHGLEFKAYLLDYLISDLTQ
jgi:hypothetical protein